MRHGRHESQNQDIYQTVCAMPVLLTLREFLGAREQIWGQLLILLCI